MSKNLSDKIHTYDPNDFKIGQYKDIWRNKGEYNTVKQVRDRFEDMDDFMSKSCPWSDPTTYLEEMDRQFLGEPVYGGTGSNWRTQWNYNLKNWAMIHQYITNSPNLPSAMIFANVQAMMAEFQENNTGVVATHTMTEDKVAVQIINLAIKNIESDPLARIPQMKTDSITEFMVLGTSILYNGYIYKARKDMTIYSTDDKIEEKVNKLYADKKWDEIEKLRAEVFQDQKDTTETDDKKYEGTKTMSDKRTLVDYSDVASVNVSPFNFYVDPSATDLESLFNDATDCVWRQTPSLDQFKTEFENSEDPYIIQANLKRVRGASTASDAYTKGKEFFKMPADLTNKGDSVELLRYYNKRTDEYIVIANDILVREGPLPYNHKKLPFSVGRFIKFPGVFWGMGLATIMEYLQSEDSKLKNLGLKLLERVLRRPTFVDTDSLDEYTGQIDKIESGDIVGLSGGVGPDKVRWEDPTNTNVGDVTAWRNSLDNESIKVSGVNPIQYALPDPGQAVRNNVMSLESSQKIMKKSFKAWGWMYADSISQWIDIMIQMYPLSILNAVDEQKETSPQYKKLLVENMSISKDANGKIVMMEDKQGAPEQEIALTPDIFKLKGRIRFRLDVEAMLPVSQATKLSTDKDVLNTLFPILANPQLMENPAIQEICRKYIEDSGFDPKIMDTFTDDDSNDDIEKAKEQIKLMLDGTEVPGIIGESPIHLYTESMALTDMMSQLVDQTLSPDVKQKLMHTIEIMRRHIAIDQIPPTQASQSTSQLATQALQAQQPPAPPQAPQPPQGGSPQEALIQQAMAAQGQQQMPLNAQNANMPPQGGM